jgi:hypothetical protein
MWLALLFVQVVGSAPAPRVEAVRTTQRPVLDGRLDDPAWQAAPPVSGFTQKFPNEAAPPSEPTTFRVLYDDDAIYVGIDCDQTLTPLNAVLTRRDREVESDRVYVHIGSRHEDASAYQFAVNAAGVLSDALQFDDNKLAPEWDENWEAQVAPHVRGWSAEFRIPLRVLRFDAARIDEWAFNVRRVISHRQETDEWAYIPRTEARVVSRYGRLGGLSSLQPGRPFELRPFVLAEVSHFQPGTAPVAGYRPQLSLGVDGKWHLSADLTVEGTVLPDFGQVEADQVILNLTNMETFFPEKRPFFLEGSDLFTTPLRIVHTRRIGRMPSLPVVPAAETQASLLEPSPIYGAAKMTGRLGRSVDVGVISALTGENQVLTSDGFGQAQERIVDPLTLFNAVRIRRSLGNSSYFGFIGTAVNRFERPSAYPARGFGATTPGVDQGQVLCPGGALVPAGARCTHDAYVTGVDGRWRSPSGEYVAAGQLAASLIREGPARLSPEGITVKSGDIDRELIFRLSKEGGAHWLWESFLSSTGAHFDRNDLGFLRRVNDWWSGLDLRYRTTRPFWGALETRTGPAVTYAVNMNGLRINGLLTFSSDWTLRQFWTVGLQARYQTSRFEDREVGDGTALERAGTIGGKIVIKSDPRRAVQGGLEAQVDARRGGADAVARANLLLRVLPQLDFELLPEVTRSTGEPRYVAADPAGPLIFGRLSAASIGSTLRSTFTFTPRLSLQTYLQVFLARKQYGQYWSVARDGGGGRQVVHLADLVTDAAPPSDPNVQTGTFNLNVVLRWEYGLGSTLFLVYTRAQIGQPPDPTNMAAPRLDLEAVRRGPAVDTLLLKLSKWWG